jgi:hypothetical protein
MIQESKNEPSSNLELPKKDAESIAISVNLLFNNAKLFGNNHPSTAQAADDLCKKVSAMARENPMITFMRSGKSFYVEKWLVDNRINHTRFTQDFDKLHIESISFAKDVLPWNITIFAECFLNALENNTNADKIQADFEEKGQKGVIINYVTLQKITKDDKIVGLDEVVVKNVGNKKIADNILVPEEKETELSQSDKMTIDATFEIIENEIKQKNFTPKKLVYLIKRIEPSKEHLRVMLPKIKTSMLETGLNVSDFLDFTTELENKTDKENAVNKLLNAASEQGIKPSEIIEAFSQNPEECVKLLLQSAEIQKRGDGANLSDYMSKMLDDIIRDTALNKIRSKKLGGDVHLAISSVISTVESGLLTKLKENGISDEEADKIHKELTQKFPKTIEHLKNEWFVNALTNLQELSADSMAKVLAKVVGSDGNFEIYKDSLARFGEKMNLSAKDLANIIETARKQRELLEKKKDLPLLPPKTTVHFIKRYIAEFKRHKNPFSMIVISDKRQNSQSVLTLSEGIAYLISKGFRFLDISGFVNIKGKDIAVIILPMTGSAGLQTVLKKIDKQLDKDAHIITSITLENPGVDEDDYESVIKKLLRGHV